MTARADSRIHPRTVPGEVMKMMNVKRQTSSEVDACVEEKLESALVDSGCNSSFIESFILSLEHDYEDLDSAPLEVVLDVGFRLLCMPKCGKPILEVNKECGTFDESPLLEDFFVDGCSTNANGQPCYSFISSYLEFFNRTEYKCFVFSKLKESCDCEGKLSPEVDELGCCINVYHDLFQKVAEEADSQIPYEPQELYTEYCDVNLPRDCNNSPLGGSVGIQYTVFAILAATLLAMFA